MPTACSSAATVCASRRRRKPSPLDRVQPLMERSQPSSGRSATPADISRNGRPTSIGTGGRHQSECPADIIGIRTAEVLAMAEDARRMPSRESEYRNLILNQRVEASSPWISRGLWQSCAARAKPIEGVPVYAGLDLSEIA